MKILIICTHYDVFYYWYMKILNTYESMTMIDVLQLFFYKVDYDPQFQSERLFLLTIFFKLDV